MKKAILIILALIHTFLYGEDEVRLSAEKAPKEGYTLYGSVSAPCSIIFGYKSDTQFFSLNITRWKAELCRNRQGSRTPLLSHTFPSDQKKDPFSLMLKQRHKTIYVYKDHTLLFSKEQVSNYL